MHLRRLHYLQLIIESGSFALAAKAADISQPAMSMAMQTLEAACRVPLFEKVGRQKVPTAAALQIAQRASLIAGQLDQIQHASTHADAWAPRLDMPQLRAGMAPAAALLYAPTIEQQWRQHEPEGLLQIVGGSAPELLSALQAGQLDLVIAPRPRRFRTGGLKRLALHTSNPIVHARRGHPLARARSLDDILPAAWAVAGNAGTAGNVIEEAHRVRRLPAPRVLVQCADYATLLNLVAHSDLLCVVPHAALVMRAHELGIVPLRLREGLPQYEVCLFWRPAATAASKALTAIVAALTAQVAGSS